MTWKAACERAQSERDRRVRDVRELAEAADGLLFWVDRHREGGGETPDETVLGPVRAALAKVRDSQ